MNLLTALLTKKHAKKEWNKKRLQSHQDMQKKFIKGIKGSGLSFRPQNSVKII